ncbi:MAG: 3-phosphoshikimate 1-carboxyvinyltransferase [Mailhella sp.]|nr:3-phosphoshikimate 1-carboxyvinyltransferase [Mailhella sp.]
MITLPAPPSKSLSHRALIAAALAEGESLVSNCSECGDLARTEDILRAAGARIEREGPGVRRVTGMAGGPRGGDRIADAVLCGAGESGTSCRILTAVLAAGRGYFRLTGSGRLDSRPLGELIAALRDLGAGIVCERKDGHIPLLMEAGGLEGGDISITLEESSQYLSGLLLAAPLCRTPLRITITGSKTISWPYAALTLAELDAAGIPFLTETRELDAPLKRISSAGDSSEDRWRAADWRGLKAIVPGALRITVWPSSYKAGSRTVEGDWSGASYLIAAGLAGNAPVRVCGLEPDSLQGDRIFAGIARSMGADIECVADGIIARPSRLHGVNADMGGCPDLVPTIAVLAAFAEGDTVITGAAHLRFKESDRIAAICEELARAGIAADELPDGLRVHGIGRAPIVSGVRFQTHNDHRIAMAFSLFGLRGGKSRSPLAGNAPQFDNPAVVAKSFPGFWDQWGKLLP